MNPQANRMPRQGHSIQPYQVHVFHYTTLYSQEIPSDPIFLKTNGLAYLKALYRINRNKNQNKLNNSSIKERLCPHNES